MELPNKPSELMRLAVKDLMAIETDPAYTINMSYWHYPLRIESGEGTITRCAVCMAGAVLANTLHKPATTEQYPDIYPREVKDALQAIDAFRAGSIHEGCSYLRLPYESYDFLPWEIPIANYDSRVLSFYDDMDGLIELFESVGL